MASLMCWNAISLGLKAKRKRSLTLTRRSKRFCLFCYGVGGQKNSRTCNKSHTARDGQARVAMGASVKSGMFADTASFVPRYPNPIAVILGENDPFISRDYLQSLAWGSLWRGEIQIMAGCGHPPFVDDPHGFDRLLDEFATWAMACQ